MAMVCPKCAGSYEHQFTCPICNERLEFSAIASLQGGSASSYGTGWQHSTAGRIIFGLLLAQGFALGVRMFFDASLFTLPPPDETDPRAALYSILMVQGVQALCLLVSCILAGAGQYRGYIIGAGVGLINAVLHLAIHLVQNQPVNEVIIYGQPLLHAFVGAVGGTMGSLIWRPLPVINLAPAIQKKEKRRDRSALLFGGPIAWFRVLVGTAVVVAGVLSPQFILNFVIYHSSGNFQISSQMQSTLITWEIIGLFILLGSGIAGFNTFNGPKQGLCVGIAASFLVVGYQYSIPGIQLEEMIFTAFVIITLSLVGSWFSCRLFPPVLSLRRRRISEAP